MIRIENLTKSYLTSKGRHYVFKNLNIELPSGKNIALIGRNGAGKSTLLRMIGGIDRPDSGEIIADQTISWPVGLAGGFQGSLTGRDNVKFVARLYEKKERQGSIISFVKEFSELGAYFDMPIRTYSSGMRSRLSFGLSMAFNFDYYLVDEVISVGDAKFKKKCEDVFNKKRRESCFIFVSHNLNTLVQYCDLGLLIHDSGRVSLYDDVRDAVNQYKNNIS